MNGLCLEIVEQAAIGGTLRGDSLVAPAQPQGVWHDDGGSVTLIDAPAGKLRKVILLSQIDNATRFVTHSYSLS